MTVTLFLAQAVPEFVPAETGGLEKMLLVAMNLFFIAGLFLSLRLFLKTNGRFPEWIAKDTWILNRPWDRFDAIFMGVVLLGLILVLTPVVFILVQLGIVDEERHRMLLVVVESILIQGSTIGCICYLIRRKKLTWHTAFGFKREGCLGWFKAAFVYYLTIMPVIVICGILHKVFMDYLGKEMEAQDVVELLKDTESWGLGYMIFLALVVAPVVEEIIFRGMVFPLLSRKIGVIPSMVAVSLLFGMVHGEVHLVLPLGILSFTMCLAYLKFRTLLVPIFIHFIFNGVMVCGLLAGKT